MMIRLAVPGQFMLQPHGDVHCDTRVWFARPDDNPRRRVVPSGPAGTIRIDPASGSRWDWSSAAKMGTSTGARRTAQTGDCAREQSQFLGCLSGLPKLLVLLLLYAPRFEISSSSAHQHSTRFVTDIIRR